MKRNGSWGEEAGYPIRWERVKKAFHKNITSKHVWIPALSAGVIHVGNYDEKISNWASSENPIFDSSKQASRYSDSFKETLLISTYATSLLTSSWDQSDSWIDYFINKVRGTAVVYLSINAGIDTTNNIRKFVFRERPSGSDFRSLPSGHATEAGSYNVLIHRNIESIGMSESFQTAGELVSTTLAAGTAWSRVEAKAHYPTDVLLGYSLGHFMSGFVFDSLMNLEDHEFVSLYPTRDGATLAYRLTY